MINKISYTPSFTSNVRVVYDNYFGLRDFYSSRTVKKQLERIENNGLDDETVTLIPVRGNRTEPSAMKVQVMKNYYGKLFYNTEIAYVPESIYQAYDKASKFKGAVPKSIRNDIVLTDYIA